MKIYTQLFALMLPAMASQQTWAKTHLSLQALNQNIEACYQLTLKREREDGVSPINEGSCSRVIANDWTRDDIKVNALFNRALVRHHNRASEGAMADMQALLQIVPDHAEGHALIAQLKHASGELSAAVHHYEKALAYGVRTTSHIKRMRQRAAFELNEQVKRALSVQVKH